jgi:rubrerythrin
MIDRRPLWSTPERPFVTVTGDIDMPITTPKELRQHLALAMQVELTTVPPYLFAMYSIEDQASEAARLIKSVVAEEMLHAALVANLLVAVGGRPNFRDPSLIPTYPGPLPHHVPPLMLNLAPASPELIRDVFMVIEQPEAPGAPPEDDEYETLGQFYYALELALEDLSDRFDLFADVQADRQFADSRFYSPVEFDAEDSGGLMLVKDLDSACKAIEVVVHQGEGVSDERYADPSHQELTHFCKFEQIAAGVSSLGEVRPVMVNPKTADLPELLRPVSDLVNALYRFLYLTMDELYQPVADKGALVDRLYGVMSGLLGPAARFLMEQPVGDGLVAGPSFEVFTFAPGSPAVHQLKSMAERVLAEQPGLAPLASGFDRL